MGPLRCVVRGMPDHSQPVTEVAVEEAATAFEVAGEAEYRPGSAADFDRLYRNSYARLKRTLTAVLGDPAAAEDCVQETFVRAFRAWSRWTPDAPAEAWLHRIAMNRAHSHRRRMALQGIAEVLKRLGRPEPIADPADSLGWSELKKALQRLPPKLTATIVLRYYHGYTNREIATAFGISERMVGLRLLEAKRKLRARLGVAVDAELPTSALGGVVVGEMPRSSAQPNSRESAHD